MEVKLNGESNAAIRGTLRCTVQKLGKTRMQMRRRT